MKYQKGIEAALRASSQTPASGVKAVLAEGAERLSGDYRLGWICGMALVAAAADRRWTHDGAAAAIRALQRRRKGEARRARQRAA